MSIIIPFTRFRLDFWRSWSLGYQRDPWRSYSTPGNRGALQLNICIRDRRPGASGTPVWYWFKTFH
jgi:hypothetical protein